MVERVKGSDARIASRAARAKRMLTMLGSLLAAMVTATTCSDSTAPKHVALARLEAERRQVQVPRERRVTPKSRAFRSMVLIAAESVVHGIHDGEPQILDSKGQPIAYKSLSIASRLEIDAQVRGFGRALLKGEQIATRSSIAAATRSDEVRRMYRFEFDEGSGDVKLDVTFYEGTGCVTFNTYRLASMAAQGIDNRTGTLEHMPQ